MPLKKFTVLPEYAGMRADKFLTDRIEGLSRDKVGELFGGGAVLLNGKVLKGSYKIKAWETLSVEIPEIAEIAVLPENIPIEIVYEDDSVAVVDKPAGMVVHPAPGNYSGTLVNALMYHLDGLSAINGVIRPGIVHRIDKDTSGLLVIAKTDKAHRALSEQFEAHSITRVYTAFVHGVFERRFGLINAPIARNVSDRKTFAVSGRNSKNALTRYSVEKQYKAFALLELRLETGRTHQIRVHMKYIGHPVVGDKTYGVNTSIDGLFKGQLLHAGKLGFIHPVTGDYMEFVSPLPPGFTLMSQIIN
ncbi:MAG: RluA family pseudouridine synthase [Eubacteriaceae bacterium]|nr:RluA family pseudouridine synthase [Eubacteriaceae bacterium]